MKNCLVIGGEYRTFDSTYQGIAAFAKENDLDVYCHLWSNDKEEIENVKERLNPTRFSYDDHSLYKDSFLEIEEQIKTVNPKNKNQDKLWQNASMHYSRKKAFDLVPKDKYENVVFLRYDILINSPMSIQEYPQGVVTEMTEAWGLISDVFAVMPYKYAKFFFLYEDFERLHSTPFEEEFVQFLRTDFKYPDQDITTHKDSRYCPHMILIRNFFLNQVPWGLFNFPTTLFRESKYFVNNF
jgi:hypothetical protein